MIALLAKIIAAFNANSRPGEIGAAFACGVMLALIPSGNLLWIVLFMIFFFFRLHISTMILSILIFKLFIGLVDPLLDRLGLMILEAPALYPLFTEAVNTPVLPYLRFENSLVTGGFVAGVLLWLPLFFLGTLLVKSYRRGIREKIAESRLVKFFEKFPLVKKLIVAVRKSSIVYRGWSS
jgi:uncharacterized protein (TIGR03546 family)